MPNRLPQARPLPHYNKNPVYHQLPVSPIHLSSSIVLRSGTVGEPSPAAFLNPMGKDMELLEVKFEISGPLQNGNTPVFGGTISCEMVLGEIKVTNGAIPVWNFGRAENLDGETVVDTTDVVADRRGFSAFSWRLPRPLFIPAGNVLKPKFTHTGYVPDTLNVRVGYSCRTVNKAPKKVCVPWVAKYASIVFNPLDTAAKTQSAELDLVNSNPEPLHLQRFVGRTLLLSPDGTGSENFPQLFGSQALKLRIVDSYGRPIVRSFTPFRSVFAAATRSWELDNGSILDPNSFYRVLIQKDAMVLADPGWSGQAFVSMVGWREVTA